MNVAIVGRGRLGAALGRAAQDAGHSVAFLRRPRSAARVHAFGTEEVLDLSLDWKVFGLVLLAFEKHAETLADLEGDEGLSELVRIPRDTPIGSVVATPAPDLVDALLPHHAVTHFLSTPAVQRPGAIALIRPSAADATAIKMALPALRWFEPSADDFGRFALLLLAGAMACAAIGHLQGPRSEPIQREEALYLQAALEDAKCLLELNDGDGRRAYSAVATPGGITEKVHDVLFQARWSVG